ncbi:unnamed protein product [Rotaria socialis]|uniref:Uncharacterized protein n=2 Tax=Rotaria socialis TaxID=392032 RepID=A0A818WYL9_9BILA|nr:unnamed protein product [Rotaria socialis]
MTSFDGVNEGGAESRDNDENEDDAHELVYPPEDGVLSRSDDVSNDKIPQHAAEHSHPVKTIKKDDRKSCLQCSAKRR